MQRKQRVHPSYRIICKFFIFILLGTAASGRLKAQVLSGAYTINSAVATGGTNFQTFADAANALIKGISSPVTFNVTAGSGPYIGDKVVFTKVTGASRINTITFNGNGATIQFKESDPATAACIKLDGASHFIFDNLKVESLVDVPEDNGKSTNAYCFQLLRNADSNIIRKCTLTGFSTIRQATVGVLINGGDGWFDTAPSKCDYNTITENTIINQYSGIEISSQDPVDYLGDYTIDSTKVTFNTIRNASYGINMFGTNRALIEGNDIGGNMTRGQAYGIWFDERNFGTTIIKNRFHDFAPDPSFSGSSTLNVVGMFLAGSSFVGREITIANNLIYNLNAPGGATGMSISDGGAMVAFMNIYNNTISMDQATGTRTGTTVGVNYNSKAEKFNFQNNIISITRGGTGRNTLYEIGTNTLPALVTFDRNDLYNGATEGSSNITGRYRGTSYATLLDFQKASTMDWHSTNQNPLYTSLATGNLTPANAGMDNWGLPAPKVTVDITNATRSTTTPDLGAYEFTTPPCTSPPTPGTAVILPATEVCTTIKMVLSLTGNSAGSAQTYQWESSDTETGTYANIGTAAVTPLLDIVPTSTKWYRCKVTCSGVTSTSTPVQVLVNPYMISGTYTINSAQATGGTNFKTFADAILAMKCGIGGPVVFNVVAGSGPYIEQVIIPQIANTSAVNTVTFNGNNETLRFISASGSQRAIIKLDGADYIIIEKLRIYAPGLTGSEYGYCVQLINSADNNIIRNCTIECQPTITSSNFNGVVISGSPTSATSGSATGFTNMCDSNTIVGNTIISGNYGITIAGGGSTPETYPTNNKILNNTFIDPYFNGMYLLRSTNTLVEGNDISRPGRTGATNFSAIWLEATNPNMKISKNKIHNAFDKNTSNSNNFYGVHVYNNINLPNEPVIVSNNIIYNVTGLCYMHGFRLTGAQNAKFYHNTLAMDVTSTVTTRYVRGISVESSSTGIEFKNNNITITKGGAGLRHAIYLGSSGEKLVSDYNNFYVKGANATENAVAYDNGNARLTLDAWKANSTNDAHSLELNPVYADSTKQDYTPTILALDNKGTPVNILTDIKAAARNATTPDIGAFEFLICVDFTTAPQLVVDSVAMNLLRFKWSAVPSAIGYKVSRDGVAFTDPSSGVLGLTHTIGGLRSADTLGLIVKAINYAGCRDTVSARVVGLTLSDMIYLPNTFTPNGDGRNDFFRVYGNNAVGVQMMIFNQWGEKVYQSSSITPGWDGSYNGKQQPVGVYVVVATVTLRDGTKITKRGSINLIR